MDQYTVAEFEKKFASLIRHSDWVPYTFGRMGFYEVMRIIGTRAGDEVILLGATCAVMANAVLRLGATPVFADFDPSSFGSSPHSIEHCITDRTKMIVALHSFGIPCQIF